MATNFWRKLSQDTGLHFEDKRIFGWVDGYHVTFAMVLGMTFRFQVFLPAHQVTATNKAIKQMHQFIASAISGIASLGIPPVKTCSHCGKVIESSEVPVRIKDDVFPMHDNCAEEAIRQQAWIGEPKKGSLPLGILGAAIAALLGAIPWAVVFALGYIVGYVGLLIGFMVGKGYDLLHGRQGRAKIAIVLLFANI